MQETINPNSAEPMEENLEADAEESDQGALRIRSHVQAGALSGTNPIGDAGAGLLAPKLVKYDPQFATTLSIKTV